MRLLFVKSPRLGSRILRWGLEESVSHVVVEFDGKYHQFFHSYGSGLQPMTPIEYLEHGYIAMFTIDLPATTEQEMRAQDEYYWKAKNHRYDYPGFLYFAYRVVLKKFFGTEYPSQNPWAKMEMNLCTEALYLASGIYAEITGYQFIPSDIDLAMTTPESAYFAISKYMREELKL